jgi:hypothetical protein
MSGIEFRRRPNEGKLLDWLVHDDHVLTVLLSDASRLFAINHSLFPASPIELERWKALV